MSRVDVAIIVTGITVICAEDGSVVVLLHLSLKPGIKTT
jgi:hypothetical protein